MNKHTSSVICALVFFGFLGFSCHQCVEFWCVDKCAQKPECIRACNE